MPVRVELITHAILLVRGKRVILDAEFAALYDVTTKALNQAVKRNVDRFRDDFVFRLTRDEVDALNRSQSVTGSQKHRDLRFPPFAFTEHGAIMAATVDDSAVVRSLDSALCAGLIIDRMQTEADRAGLDRYDVAAVHRRVDLLSCEIRAEVAKLGAELRTEISRTASDGLRQMYMALLAQAIVMFAFVCFVAALRS